MMRQPTESANQFLFWWVGDVSFEADIGQAARNKLNPDCQRFVSQHIKDDESLQLLPKGARGSVGHRQPSTSTWSRARGVSLCGPPTLRSQVWPWVAPALSDRHRAAVERDNAQLRLALAIAPQIAHGCSLSQSNLGAHAGRPSRLHGTAMSSDVGRRRGSYGVAHFISASLEPCDGVRREF